jgi:hypothetical protein
LWRESKKLTFLESLHMSIILSADELFQANQLHPNPILKAKHDYLNHKICLHLIQNSTTKHKDFLDQKIEQHYTPKNA